MEEEDDGGSKWKEMETDCLVLIFQKLNLQDLALSVPFVCKTWLQASLSPPCWRVLDFRRLDFAPGSEFGGRFAARHPSPRRAAFSAFMKLAVRRSCGAAAELHFPLFFEVSAEDLVRASTGVGHIQFVEVEDGNSATVQPSEIQHPQLAKCARLFYKKSLKEVRKFQNRGWFQHYQNSLAIRLWSCPKDWRDQKHASVEET